MEKYPAISPKLENIIVRLEVEPRPVARPGTQDRATH